MSVHIMTFTCEPGTLTLDSAMKIQESAIDALNAIADEMEPGAVTFKAQNFTWVDDGKDEVVIRVLEVPS